MMAVDDVHECPLCMENLDIDDKQFFPCTCGYQICRFCWHRIRMNENGLCPACRKPYPENPANFKPLSVEDVQKMKAQKRQKEQMKKQKTVDSRRHLADLRVVQKNLVFVVGIAQRIADEDSLKKNEYFGKFGKIQKVVVNSSLQGNSAGAYITYYKSEDALRAIQSVNNVPFDGRTIKASLGTTKYCSHFMRNQQCPKPECMYLHHYGDTEASFTKEDMQLGKHQDYERKLLDDFVKTNSGVVNIKKQQKERTVSGGSSGEPERTAQPLPLTPSNSFKECNMWANGSAVIINGSSNSNSNSNSNLSTVGTGDDDTSSNSRGAESEAEEAVISSQKDNIEMEEHNLLMDDVNDECSNDISNESTQDDDLGFDPFHETQKAFEELIQEEVKNQRFTFQSPFSLQTQLHYGSLLQPQHQQLRSAATSGLMNHHPQSINQSLLQHQQHQMNSSMSSMFPRTLLPPPGFNSSLIQQPQNPLHQYMQPQQQQTLPNLHHHWPPSHGHSSEHNHHQLNHGFKSPHAPLKETDDFIDPAIIFSSNHHRPQHTMNQTPQNAPPGFQTLNGHLKSHPHF